MTFPQLGNGSTAQWPIVKSRRARGVMAETPGGYREAVADAGDQRCEWELRYGCLTTKERDILVNFFANVEGRLQEFLFLDPLGNLLRWSGDWSKDTWVHDPQLQVTTREGGTTLMNSGQSSQAVWQVIEAPASFWYSFGARLRAAAAAEVTVFLGDGSDRVTATKRIGTDWTDVTVSGRLLSESEQVRFGLELPSGAMADVAYAAASPQPGLEAYQITHSQSGVYPRARFSDDDLRWTSYGPDWHALTLKVTAWAGQ